MSGRLFPFHCVRLGFARRVSGLSALARPRSRRAETPPAATRQRVRGRGPLGVRKRTASPTPQPRSARRVPAASGEMAAHPSGGWNTPHPQGRCSPCKAVSQSCRHGGSRSVAMREGGGEIRPAGEKSHGAGACGSRAARPAGGNAGPDRASHAREGNSEGPHAGLRPAAGGIAREGGSEGCARCAARATAQSPRGKKKPHAVKKKSLVAHPPGKTKAVTQRQRSSRLRARRVRKSLTQ
jgi:hypothetical protein